MFSGISLYTVYIFQFQTTIISVHVKLDHTNSYVTLVRDICILTPFIKLDSFQIVRMNPIFMNKTSSN